MRILFLSEQFYPEVNAGASRTLGHVRLWRKKGADVTVITSAPNFPRGILYEGYRNELYHVESVAGVKVVRVWTFIARNSGFLKRILDFASYMLSSFLAGMFIKADLIVVTSPQFLATFSAYALSIVKGVPWVFEIRDLWPESIAGLGWMSEKSLAYKLLQKAEIALYHRADRIVVVTEYFKDDLIRRGIRRDKIEVIVNGIDEEDFELSEDQTKLRANLDLPNVFTIGYVGTIGEAQDFDFILRCAKVLEHEVKFIFVGEGSAKEQLVAQVQELALSNVIIRPMIPRTEVKNYLGAIDLSLACLKSIEAFEKVIPSKIFEAAAMKKPILLSAKGQARQFVEHNGIGLLPEQGNIEDFVGAVRLYKASPELQEELLRACLLFSTRFHRQAMADKMFDILENTLKTKEKELIRGDSPI